MHEEITAAVIFLTRLIEKGENLNQKQLDEFKSSLSGLLSERFENHWFPEIPQKGQGYRCIRVNEIDRHDVSLEKAAKACGIKYEDMKLPVELTIWVDPNEVCCRFGENKGSYCTLASFNDKENVAKVCDQVKDLNLKQEIPKEKESHVPSKESAEEKKQESESTTVKPQIIPLTNNNLRQAHQNGRKYSQGSPKQKSRRGCNMGGYPQHHGPMQSWYNIVPPHWSSHTYHPMLRQGGPLPPHHSRYNWPNKHVLKV